jgi:hypothetical protein
VAAQIGWPSESEFVAMKRIAQKAAAQRTTAEKNLFEKFADWRAAHPGWPQWTIEEYRRRKQDVYAAQVPPDLGFPPSGGHQIPPEGDGDVGGGGEGGDTGTGGGTGGGDTGGGGTGGTIDIEAQIAAGVRAQLNAFLGARSAQFADLAPNIFTPTGEGLGLGSSGPLRSVTVIQNFPTPPDDQFALLRHVAFAAGAHVGR